MPEFIINPHASKAELDSLANQIGDSFKKMSIEKGKDQVCSDLISNEIITFLYIVTKEIDRPLSDLRKDEKSVKTWMAKRFVFDMIRTAISDRFELNYELLLDDYALRENAERLPHMIGLDIMAFCTWCIIHGADSNTIRRTIQTKSYEYAMKQERLLGSSIFISALVRACCVYLSLSDKVFEPELKKLKAGKCERKINAMSDSLNELVAKFNNKEKRNEKKNAVKKRA